MVKLGKPAETKEHPLSGSGILRTVALNGDYQLDTEGQSGEDAGICNYQVEGRHLGENSLELRPT